MRRKPQPAASSRAARPLLELIDHRGDDAHHLQVGILHLAEVTQRGFQSVLGECIQRSLPLSMHCRVRPLDLAEAVQRLDIAVALAVVPATETTVALARQLRNRLCLVAQQVGVSHELQCQPVELGQLDAGPEGRRGVARTHSPRLL